MKKTKILSVLGVLIAMGITACGGSEKKSDAPKSEEPAPSSEVAPVSSEQAPGTSEQAPVSSEQAPASSEQAPASSEQQPSSEAHVHSFGTYSQTKAPTCTEAGSEEATCACGEKDVRDIPALGHDFAGEGATKVDALEEEGALAEEMYKCSRCKVTSVRWSALDYDQAKTTARSTAGPESRDSGKAIRFTSTPNYSGGDTTKKGCHIVYNVYIPEPAQNLKLAVNSSRRTDIASIFNKDENDNAKGYEYVGEELVRPDSRYGIKIDGEVVILPKDESGQVWKDGINWYVFPGEFSFATAGVHEVEIYNLGGYRAEFYNFELQGFGEHEHVANYKPIDSRLNSDNKTVLLGEDKFLNNKAIEIAFKDFSDAPVNPSGTNPWYMAKGSFATWKVSVDKAIENAELYFSLECSSDTHLARHLFNEAKWNEEHPDNPVALPGQSPDTTSEDDWRYSIFVGETEFPILNNGTMAESGVKKTNTQTYVYFGKINLAAGENVIKLSQNNIGYRMKFNQNVRIVFNTDAVIDGTHAHMFTELVSETPATCEGKGSKVMKCLCGETDTVETPALGHDFEVGTADENGVSALTCKRDGCTAAGIQFNGFTGDNAAANDNGKLNKNATVNFSFNMPAVGKATLYINAAYSAGNGNKTFASGWAIKGGASADALADGTLTLDTDARADSKLQQVSTYTFLEIGYVEVAAAGAYIISVTTYGSSAQARLMIDGLVRIVY